MGCGSSKKLNPEAKYDLAVWYRTSGEIDLAEEQFEELLEISRENNGELGEMTLNSLGHLAMIKMTKLEYNAAEQYLVRLLAGKLKCVGSAHKDSLYYVGVLTRCLEGQGRSREDIKAVLQEHGYDLEVLDRHVQLDAAELEADKDLAKQRQQVRLHASAAVGSAAGGPIDIPVVSVGYESMLLPKDYLEGSQKESRKDNTQIISRHESLRVEEHKTPNAI